MGMIDVAHDEMAAGVREVPGPDASPRIMEYFAACGGTWVKDDATPWCGAGMGWICVEEGHPLPPQPLRARSWLRWGQECMPQRGCVVVLERGDNPDSGHVGLLDRIDEARGVVYVTGGNQGDTWSTAPFPIADVLGYRWPEGESRGAAAQEAVQTLPIYRIIDRIRQVAKWLGIGGGTAAATAKQAGVKVTAFDGLLTFAGDNWALALIVCGLLVYSVAEIIKDQMKTDVRTGAIVPPAPGLPAPATT